MSSASSALLALALWLPPAPPAATPVQPVDSISLHEEAREAQEHFERIRVREAPRTWWGGGWRCDEVIGRICLRLPSEEGSPGTERRWIAEPEPPAIEEAKSELLAVLERVGAALPGDPWVQGQRIAYLGESGRWEEALAAARSCRAEGWWCAALEGFALHHLDRPAEALDRFESALAAMPVLERERWESLERILEPAAAQLLRERGSRGKPGEWTAAYWRLADPLFLLPGNALWTEHMARHTLARIREGAHNPYGLRWGDDLSELLVRYGPVVTYRRVRQTGPSLGMPPPEVVGHFPPGPRFLLPSEPAVERPAESRRDDWRTDLRRRARSLHAIPGAPRIRALDAQVVRFRRGDSLQVAVRWELPGEPAIEEPPELGPWIPDPAPLPPYPPEHPEVGLFLVRLPAPGADAPLPGSPSGPGRNVPLGNTGGMSVLTVLPGHYLLSMEVLDREGGRAWRVREGIGMRERVQGVVDLSDLLLVRPAGAADEGGGHTVRAPPDLPGLLARGLAGSEVEDEAVEVAWEVYGLTGEEGGVRYHLSVSPIEGGLLRRLGRFLRVVPWEDRLELRWEEGAEVSPAIRSVVLNLSSLPSGPIRITLTLEPPGRTPAVTERVIELRR